MEQLNAEQAPQTAVSAGFSQGPTRPIASTRHRRAESFRSLRSTTSDESPSWSVSTPSYASSAVLQSPFVYQQPTALGGGRFGYETATALLDLDFVIIRANRPFEQIMHGGRVLRGRHISDVAGPADSEVFQNIRNRLRAEREAREPAYMPPILQSGQDPLQGVSDPDVDRFTDSFSDTTYTWTQTQLGAPAQTFPARVRLAKAGIYFVVVTLPSFKPIDQPPLQPVAPSYGAPLMLGPPLPGVESYGPPRQSASQSTPSMAYFPFSSTAVQSQPPLGSSQQVSSFNHPTPQPPMPYLQQSYTFQQLPAPSTPRLPIAEPPTETTAFTPRSLPRDIMHPTIATELQLPPLGSPAVTGRSRATTMDSIVHQASSEEGESEQSPRKRRRMGIDEVLQR